MNLRYEKSAIKTILRLFAGCFVAVRVFGLAVLTLPFVADESLKTFAKKTFELPDVIIILRFQLAIIYSKEGKKFMKFPGGFDMNSMMKQAQKMQEEMGKQMKEMTVDATAGGGAVTVKMRGDFEVLNLTISPDLVKDGDVEMIQDLTLAAINEARRKVEESLKGKLGGMLPPGLM
jgi:DNA-binding YbaB/EbfC family protein